MRRAGVGAVIRFTNSLLSASPGTTACRPPRSAFAAASLSSRRGIFFAVASGPWQPKHLSESIGRTSRLNEICPYPVENARMKRTNDRIYVFLQFVTFCGAAEPQPKLSGVLRDE